MPFTLSHPLIVLPLVRTGLPLSALVIGAIMPDMIYAARMREGMSHSLWGILCVCLPIALLGYYLFHGVLKVPLIALLPDKHRDRLMGVEYRTVSMVWVVIALLLGLLSHLLLDGISWKTGWITSEIPFMQQRLLKIDNAVLRVHGLLSHAYSVIAGIVLVMLYRIWFKKASVANWPYRELPHRLLVVMGILLLALASSSLYNYIAVRHLGSLHNIRKYLGFVAKDAIFLSVIFVCVYAGFWWRVVGQKKP